ncbi:hypothetical protein CEAn_00058 [Coxiella endosymbiont of Amblyomma nuttalli]|nr:hypothetical protein CEAn_00058 [Coxiella endosymbiont of Amblyomma nuttalli]
MVTVYNASVLTIQFVHLIKMSVLSITEAPKDLLGGSKNKPMSGFWTDVNR